MAAYRRVYDSRHLQADCQETGPAPEPYTHSNAIAACKKFTAHDSDQRLQTFAMAEYIHRVSKKFICSYFDIREPILIILAEMLLRK